eukprot:gene50177-18269_t
MVIAIISDGFEEAKERQHKMVGNAALGPLLRHKSPVTVSLMGMRVCGIPLAQIANVLLALEQP